VPVREISKYTRFVAIFLALAAGITLNFSAIQSARAEIPKGLRVTAVSPYNKLDPDTGVGLGDRLQVTLEGPDGTGVDTNKFKFGSLILFIDNRPMNDHKPIVFRNLKAICTEKYESKISTANKQLQEAGEDEAKIRAANKTTEEIRALQAKCGDTINLIFQLTRKQDDKGSQKVWGQLLGAPNTLVRRVPVGVGLANGEQILYKSGVDSNIKLIILSNWLLYSAAAIFLGALIMFLILWRCSYVVRGAPAPLATLPPKQGFWQLLRGSNIENDSRPPYSLGKTQMAWWFFLILGSYLFISVATFDYETISTQALVLIGIAAGTGLGAIAIESSKISTAQTALKKAKAELAKLEGREEALTNNVKRLTKLKAPDPEQSARSVAMTGEVSEIPALKARLEEQIESETKILKGPTTQHFWLDLVSDSDGVSFHRFQNVVWSIVLGGVFLFQVWQNLAMPEFSATLLTLMGITSGTYLGFKFPEKKVK